jgi:serine/threonine protein kinase
MNDLIGRTIAGRYRIETFLGKGGMAEVYKVWDQERSVYLAMKILHADLAEDKVFLRRFKREAQTLAKLQHPNIVRFYGLEQEDDLVYILMDYVEGTTLRKEIFQSKAPFSMERILEIMKPVCAALYYAHKSGFVHCDVKPANIMIHKNGTIYVSDFGIARMTEAATVTMVGAGTPAYMAPEQARGEDPVPQTDIYSLGIVLFEMLTGGERPFTGESAKTTGSTSEKVRWEQMRLAAPPPSKFNSSITQSMDGIVLKCLAKSLAARYLSATDLLSDLIREVVQVNVPIQPVPVSKPVPEQPKDEKAQSPILQPKEPVVAPHVAKEQQPFVQIESRNTPRSLKALGVIGIGILGILVIIATSVGVTYQKNMNSTATADAKNMQATATKQAQDLYATATKQEQNARATATKQAQNARATATKQAQNAQATKTVETVFSMVPQEILTVFPKVGHFDSFSTNNGWNIELENNDFYTGDKKIYSGEYVWTIKTAVRGFLHWSAAPIGSSGNFYLQVDAKRAQGDVSDVCYGLTFRSNSNGDYWFVICDDKYFEIFYASTKGDWKHFANTSARLAIHPGEVNRLGVLAQRNEFVFYINETEVFTLNDNSSLSGDVGIAIDLLSAQSGNIHFDNFILLRP